MRRLLLRMGIARKPNRAPLALGCGGRRRGAQHELAKVPAHISATSWHDIDGLVE